MTALSTNYEDVLQMISQWPPAQRILLIQSVLQSLAPELSQTDEKPQNTFSRALGLLATKAPPPIDEQIQAWLDEHRNEKYG